MVSKQSLQIRRFFWPIMSSWKIYIQNTQPCPRPSRPCRPCFPDRKSCCKDTWNNKLTNHNISCVFLDHIKISICPAPGSFPWPIIKCRSKVPKPDHWHVVSSAFSPFSLKSFLALIRGSTTLTGRWSWKFLVISWHKMQRFTCDETGLETHAPLESSAPPYNSNSYSFLPSCAVSVAPAFSPPVQEQTWNTNAIQAIPADSQILLANHVLMKDLYTKHSALSTSITTMPAMLSW